VPDWLPEVRARLHNKDRFQRLGDNSILNKYPIGSEFSAWWHLESGSEPRPDPTFLICTGTIIQFLLKSGRNRVPVLKK
jgi:hypothetical protein